MTAAAATDTRVSGRPPRPGPRLVYVVGTYPLLTTTFVDREVTTLRRRGVDVRVVAVRRPAAGTPLSEEQRSLQRDVTYLLPVSWTALLRAVLFFVARHPARFLATLGYLLGRPHSSLRARVKTLLHFGEGVYTAALVRTDHVRELHAHFADRAATMALVAARLLGTSYSLSVHTAADVYVEPVLLGEKIRHARHVVTCTGHNKAHLLATVGGDVGSKIDVVRHGLDLHAYRPTARSPASPPLILAVAQLAERKGLDRLVRSCAAVRDAGHGVRCCIVGEGPQRAQLESLAAELDLSDVVTLTGALPHERVLALYRDATIFVLPCVVTRRGDVDGIPNVLAEAMALEVPVVSTDLPAIRELVIDGENGLLVPPGNDRALVVALRRLLGDPELRSRLGANGRKTVLELFDLDVNVRRFATALWPDLAWDARG